jgi:hypothetical protein
MLWTIRYKDSDNQCKYCGKELTENNGTKVCPECDY